MKAKKTDSRRRAGRLSIGIGIAFALGGPSATMAQTLPASPTMARPYQLPPTSSPGAPQSPSPPQYTPPSAGPPSQGYPPEEHLQPQSTTPQPSPAPASLPQVPNTAQPIPPGYSLPSEPRPQPMLPPAYYPTPEPRPSVAPNVGQPSYAQPLLPSRPEIASRKTQDPSLGQAPIRDNETTWGIRFTPFLSASYTLEEFLDDESYRKGSQDFKFSFAVGAFGDHRVNKYLYLGGDFDFLLLDPKINVSRHDITMLSLGPSMRLAIPVGSLDIYFRAVGAFSVAFLPDELTQRTMYYSNGTTGTGQYDPHALGYAVKFEPGLFYRMDQFGFFVALSFEFSTVYTKLNWANGTVADLTVSPQLFGIELGTTFSP